MQNREPFKSIRHKVLPMLVLATCLLGPGRGAENNNCAGEKDIFHAAQEGDVETVKAALKEDPKIIKATDPSGRTLLHKAVMGNQSAMIRLLVKSGAELEARDALGYTPLYMAVFPYATEAGMTLIELGADYRARVISPHPRPRLSVLDHAALRGNVEIVRLLLEKGVPVVDPKHPKLNSPLHFACLHPASTPFPDENKGNRLVLDALIKHTDDVNLRNFQHLTPLHLAAQWGAVNTIEDLMKKYPSVEVNAKAPDGKTALHFAVSTPDLHVKSADRVAAIRILLDAGARLLPDSNGQTPLELARAIGDKLVIAAFAEEK